MPISSARCSKNDKVALVIQKDTVKGKRSISIQALPYLCLPQHLPAHHLGPGFLHPYTLGGEYLPRKLDPVRQTQKKS